MAAAVSEEGNLEVVGAGRSRGGIEESVVVIVVVRADCGAAIGVDVRRCAVRKGRS